MLMWLIGGKLSRDDVEKVPNEVNENGDTQ